MLTFFAIAIRLKMIEVSQPPAHSFSHSVCTTRLNIATVLAKALQNGGIESCSYVAQLQGFNAHAQNQKIEDSSSKNTGVERNCVRRHGKPILVLRNDYVQKSDHSEPRLPVMAAVMHRLITPVQKN